MPADLWAQVHGALVHFPLALTFSTLFCDVAQLLSWSAPVSAHLRSAGRLALAGGALSSLPAVASGLVLTRGGMLGHGPLRWHHLFVWPAFGLLVAAALWRWLGPAVPTRRSHCLQLAAVAVLAALMSAAGHWGGRLALAYP